MPSVQARSNLAGVSTRLHTAAADVPRQLNAAASRSLRPLQARLKGSALSTLPRRGGLNRAVAFDLRFSTRPLAHGARLEARSQYDIVHMDVGETVHPLFGNRGHWYRESVNPGWWSTVIDSVEPAARREMDTGLDNVKRKVEG